MVLGTPRTGNRQPRLGTSCAFVARKWSCSSTGEAEVAVVAGVVVVVVVALAAWSLPFSACMSAD